MMFQLYSHIEYVYIIVLEYLYIHPLPRLYSSHITFFYSVRVFTIPDLSPFHIPCVYHSIVATVPVSILKTIIIMNGYVPDYKRVQIKSNRIIVYLITYYTPECYTSIVSTFI